MIHICHNRYSGYISHSHPNLVCKSLSPFSEIPVGFQTSDLKWQLLVSVCLLVQVVLYKQIDKWRPQARLEMFVYKCTLLQILGDTALPPLPLVFSQNSSIAFSMSITLLPLYSSHSAVLVHRFDWAGCGHRQDVAKVLWEGSHFFSSQHCPIWYTVQYIQYTASSLSALYSVLSFLITDRNATFETPSAIVLPEFTWIKKNSDFFFSGLELLMIK